MLSGHRTPLDLEIFYINLPAHYIILREKSVFHLVTEIIVLTHLKITSRCLKELSVCFVRGLLLLKETRDSDNCIEFLILFWHC